ncbi:hypothetical protein [Ideonella sp.]|uniref:hypothetical protein n=1 Tax=Ideonella sp. TaxID=1929293 RepID=UPI003BB7195A
MNPNALPTASAGGLAHVCVIAPVGERSALATLDVARMLQAELQSLGLSVSLGRQRLVAGAVNFVFGAHWGFDADAAQGHRVVLVNHQAWDPKGGAGGAEVVMTPAALRQLARFPVLETQPGNVPAYRSGAATEPPLHFWQPGLAPDASGSLPMAARPIDLLLADPPDEAQSARLSQLEAMGLRALRLESTLCGPERDALIRQSRAVVFLSPTPARPMDAARLAQVLAQATAVLAERPEGTTSDEPAATGTAAWPPAGAVQWFSADPADVGRALCGNAHGADFAARCEHAVQQFAAAAEAQADARAALWRWACSLPVPLAWQPRRRLNTDLQHLGYLPGWCNRAATAEAAACWGADAQAGAGPDPSAEARFELIVLGPQALACSSTGLQAALAELAPGGRLVVRWPVPAGLDGTDAEAALRSALRPWTDAWWQTTPTGGGLAQRLELAHLGWLDADGRPCHPAQASQARAVLHARDTSYRERTAARSVRGDFGL